MTRRVPEVAWPAGKAKPNQTNLMNLFWQKILGTDPFALGIV